MNARMYAVIAALAALVLTGALNVILRTAAEPWRLDFTGAHRYSLSRATLETLQGLSEPLSLTFFVSRDALAQDPARHAFSERVAALLDAYAAASRGRVTVRTLDTRPRSPAEEAAIQAGLMPLEANWGRQSVYLGLAGANTLDETVVLPQLRLQDEPRLEAEITGLIARLEQPDAPPPATPVRAIAPAGRDTADVQRIARRLADAEAALARSSAASAQPLRAQVVALRRELRAAQARRRALRTAEEGWLFASAMGAPALMLGLAGVAAWRRRRLGER